MAERVADVGNSRIKWGLCTPTGFARTARLPLDDIEAWQKLYRDWQLTSDGHWTIAGTQPAVCERLATWLRDRGDRVDILCDYRELPLPINVRFPERVGIDRLLNAIAARERASPGQAIIIINAGSAVTVDLVDSAGIFQGGAILPGFRLMAQSLHDYTAKLPLVPEPTEMPDLPGKDTIEAITAGILHTLCGGVDRLVESLARDQGTPTVVLAGGNAPLLRDLHCRPVRADAYLTLDGIRLTVQGRS